MSSALNYYVYILTNKNRTTLYTGSTKDLNRRVLQHKSGEGSVFTKKYNLTILVYYEVFDTYEKAFIRERQLKKWNRAWKEELIISMNKEWKDLAEAWAE